MDTAIRIHNNSGPRRRGLLLLVSATLCGVLSLLNIVYQHVSDRDVAGSAEAAFRSKFLTTRRDNEASPGGGSGDDTGGGEDAVGDGVGNAEPSQHTIAGLSCEKYGGPPEEVASEMVFWSDIPSDSRYRSPFQRREAGNGTKYLTFEPDHGGWNNIRMAMETVLVLAHATGRTLVLPPEKRMYLLDKVRTEQKTSFGFNDFFHLDSIAIEHDGLEVISMETFLLREKGRLAHQETGEVLAPPGGRTKWDGESLNQLWRYLRIVGHVPEWSPNKCILGIPAVGGPDGEKELREAHAEAMKDGKPDPFKEYTGNPTSVDAPVADRMREMIGGRDALCIYDTRAQGEPLIHLKVDHSDDNRLLTHFYAFLFFQDWRQDLYYKRFVRDHVRYIDEIVCAAARIVRDVRDRAREHGRGENPDGVYDSMHVRRGDFQYKKTRIPAEDLYERSKGELEEGGTLYVATDERNKAFFQPIKDHYNVLFLDDFLDEVKGINTNYYGMLDQLVASKGRVFYGTWWSTLSGYINRMRGYHTVKHKLEGYQDGTVQSYYFIPDDRKMEMRQYMSVRLPIYMREFPTSWRNIDQGIEEIHQDADGRSTVDRKR